MQDIKDITKWIVDDDEEFTVDDQVEVKMTSGEVVIGTISYLSGDYMSVDSEKLDEVSFNLEDVEEIAHIYLDK